MSSSHVFNAIVNALMQREGRKVTLPTLMSVTGLRAEQIQGSINNARRASETHARQIEVVEKARAWRFRADQSVGNYPTPNDVVKAVEVGSTHIWKTVLAALVSNAEKPTSKELLAQLASTDEREITPIQASQAMLTVMRQPNVKPHIEVLLAGSAWRYRAEVPGVAKTSKAAKSTKTTTSEVTEVSVPIRGSVLRHFTQKPGQTLFVDDIADDLGFTKKQVQSAVWHLLKENEATKSDFVVVQPSYAWRYVPNRAETNGRVTPELTAAPASTHTPNAIAAYTPEAVTTTLPVSSEVPSIPKPAAAVATSGRLFEEVGQLTDGAILVKEAESSVIYRATPLA